MRKLAQYGRETIYDVHPMMHVVEPWAPWNAMERPNKTPLSPEAVPQL